MQVIDRYLHELRYSTLLQFALDKKKTFSEPNLVRGDGRCECKGCEVNEW
jgi:hypothetical protein